MMSARARERRNKFLTPQTKARYRHHIDDDMEHIYREPVHVRDYGSEFRNGRVFISRPRELWEQVGLDFYEGSINATKNL